MDQKELLKLLDSNNIKFELLIFSESVKDSKSSASASKLDLNKIAKTILFKDKQDKVYSVIIRSSERVQKSKVKDFLKSSKLDLIKFEDVIKFVNFPAGGVPPFGYDAVFIMDSDLGDDEDVLVGGGTIYSLLKLKIKDIKKLINPYIVDVKQKQ
jgi:prolyl-tRNA editing enzyme YbaK/EbsC (Cys-tRNA(Pro) deacylase)